MISIAMIFGS